MSNKENKDPGISNWLAFLLVGPLVAGSIYAIFFHGFLDRTDAAAYRASTGVAYFQAAGQIDITPVPARNAASIEHGKETFKMVCSACHGPDATGGIGPNLTDAVWLQGRTKESDLIRLVIRGIPAPETKQPTHIAMPSRGNGALTNEQLWEVLYFLGTKNPTIQKDAETAAKEAK
ncbi:MAG: cytochrome c [Spirochaetia bacterium]|nr:cytochrome c [Spirochaetia bacterium]